MKKSQENKTTEDADQNHNVETPEPPQVMNPSVPPFKNEEGKNRGHVTPAEKKERKKKTGRRKNPAPEAGQ